MINEENEKRIAPIIGQLYLRSIFLSQEDFDRFKSIMQGLGYRAHYQGTNTVSVRTPHYKIFYDANELVNRNLRAAAKQEEV